MNHKKSGHPEGTIVKMAVFFILVVFAVFVMRYIHLIFSSDSLASDVLVQEIISCKTISIKDYTAQQTFFQFNILFYLPKLLLQMVIQNTVFVDKLCALLLYLLFLFLIYWLHKSFIGDPSVWIVIGVLGCGVSFAWLNIAVIELAYTCHIIYMIIFLILMNTAFEKYDSKYSKKQYGSMAVLSLFIIYVLSFDQRYTAIFIIPYYVALCAVAYIEKYRLVSFRSLGKVFIFNFITCSGVLAGSTLAGLLVNACLKKTLPFLPRLTNLDAYKFADFKDFFQAFAIHLSGILRLWGCDLDMSVSVFSMESAVYLLKGTACVCCMVIFPVLCFVKYKKLPEGIKKLLWFYVVMTAELFYIYVLSSYNTYANERYFVYEVVISLLISAWYLYEHMIKRCNLNRSLIYMILSVFVLSSLGESRRKVAEYEGLYVEREALIESLEEHGLFYGYATYWNAQILTSLSNTKIKVLPILLQETTISPIFDINYIHQFSSSNYSGSTFLLLTVQESTEMAGTIATLGEEIGEPVQTITFGNYVALIYDYNIAARARSFPYNDAYSLPYG